MREESLPQNLFDSTLGFLSDLAAISSPSVDPDGLARVAAFLREALEARGLAVEIEPRSALEGGEGSGGATLPVLHARGPAALGENARCLLLLGHMDTVLPAIAPERRDGRLLATGAIDMKGGLATFVGALDLLASRGAPPPQDLHLVVVPDEEVGGVLSREATSRWGGAARAVWVLEPGEPRGDAETMVAGRRGMSNWRLSASGTPAHSGVHYWQGHSALVAAARWCAGAEALSARGGGPTINVGRLIAGDVGFVSDPAGNASLLGTESRLNVVPERAIAEGEFRFLRAAEGERVAADLAALALTIGQESGTTLELAIGHTVPPVDPYGPQRSWCDRAVALAAARGWTLEVEDDRGGISFPNFLPDPGRVPVLDGLGPVGGGMHTREEFLDLTSLARRVVLLADLFEADAAAR
ncbi:MAG TPA: M20/M25/M40 family metallo-hydrolase [Thermoanaerobaculia bacterium]|jgi:glutamate carboxypeptidase|nr:M20/M25/M40 family metallo-hydrolase [Thermoanaerobaculia bacterium]